MSDYLDPNNEELLKDFFSEATLQVELLEQNILAVEDDPDDRDAIDEIFRAAHTLKGGSATVQMTELSEFTHLVEDLLDAIRSEKVKINSNVVDTLLTAIDIIKLMLETRQAGDIYNEDISQIKKDLKAIAEQDSPVQQAVSVKSNAVTVPEKAPVAPKASVSIKDPQTLSEYEVLELKEAAGKGNTVYLVKVTFDENNPMNTVGGIQVFAKLKNFSQVLKTNPDFELLYEDNFFPVVYYYIASDNTPDEICARTATSDVTLDVQVRSLDEDGSAAASPVPVTESKGSSPKADQDAVAPLKEDVPRHAEPEPVVEMELGDEEDFSQPQDNGSEAAMSLKSKLKDKSASSVLRVDSKRIDNLLNLVSEAVINKATFNQISSRFTELQAEFVSAENTYKDRLKSMLDHIPDMIAGRDSDLKEIKNYLSENYQFLTGSFETIDSRMKSLLGSFKSTAANLGRNTGDLHEAILRIRMVPINQIFSRFPRLVRDLSKTLDKRVELLIEGEDTELDKSVIEELLDPLMHCVRNSLDHGIESAAQRKKKGKSETGRILLKASNEGNMIIIEVSDDGAGIDVKAVKDKAIKKGIIHPGKNLSDVEAYNLIFEPGFSTAKEVTNISGRGVGLDVVKREIEKLNGSVSVWSKPEEGTRFTIKLPLTLAIIQGLLVRVGHEVYAIPITSVIESLRIKPEEINIIDNYEVFNVRSDVISLLRLNKIFNIDTNENREFNFIVIVGSGDKKMGLMVDSLIGEEDVVIKPLKDRYTNSPGIAGATILGDGTVSLIIDVSQLLDLGVQLEHKTRSTVAV